MGIKISLGVMKKILRYLLPKRQLRVLTSRSLSVFSIYLYDYSCSMKNNTGDKSWKNDKKITTT